MRSRRSFLSLYALLSDDRNVSGDDPLLVEPVEHQTIEQQELDSLIRYITAWYLLLIFCVHAIHNAT